MSEFKQFGHWMEHTHVFGDTDYECSVCGEVSELPHRVCPACGSEMIGVESDPDWALKMSIMEELIGDD